MEQTHQAELPFYSQRDFESFKNWLLIRYEETPTHLHDVALATGYYSDYEKLMEWYRYRFRKEKNLFEQMQELNPFQIKEN